MGLSHHVLHFYETPTTFTLHHVCRQGVSVQQGNALPIISGTGLQQASKNECSHVLPDLELHLNSIHSVSFPIIPPCLMIMNKFSFSVR